MTETAATEDVVSGRGAGTASTARGVASEIVTATENATAIVIAIVNASASATTPSPTPGSAPEAGNVTESGTASTGKGAEKRGKTRHVKTH